MHDLVSNCLLKMQKKWIIVTHFGSVNCCDIFLTMTKRIQVDRIYLAFHENRDSTHFSNGFHSPVTHLYFYLYTARTLFHSNSQCFRFAMNKCFHPSHAKNWNGRDSNLLCRYISWSCHLSSKTEKNVYVYSNQIVIVIVLLMELHFLTD